MIEKDGIVDKQMVQQDNVKAEVKSLKIRLPNHGDLSEDDFYSIHMEVFKNLQIGFQNSVKLSAKNFLVSLLNSKFRFSYEI